MFKQEPVALIHSDIDDVQYLQADNAREYEKLGAIIYRSYGTKMYFTNAYTPQQNGVAERMMGTLLMRMRSLLIQAKMPKFMWGGSTTTCYLPNQHNTYSYKRWRVTLL
jgi:hypothetical protein